MHKSFSYIQQYAFFNDLEQEIGKHYGTPTITQVSIKLSLYISISKVIRLSSLINIIYSRLLYKFPIVCDSSFEIRLNYPKLINTRY